MQPAEELRVVVFIGILAAVYVLAAGTIVRWVRQSMDGPLPPLPPWSRRLRRIALGLAAAGIPCFTYGFRIHDEHGTAIAYGGRAVSDDLAAKAGKYRLT